jgi:hypothetical protein
MDSVSRRTAMLGALGVAGAAVAGCASQTSATTTGGETSASSATPSASVDSTPRWPLTGKPLASGDDPKHIAVAVKVPDNKNEHPQKGIDKADIVYVELDGYPAAVGQSGTRLVPIFHTHYAKDVGAVRSIRPVDVPMLSPITAIIGNTGAANWVLNYVKQFKAYLVTNKSYMATKYEKPLGSYSIDPSRVRTLNGVTYYDRAVLCHPAILAKHTTKFQTGPQQNYLPWAATDDEVSTVSGKDCSSISIPWKKGNTYRMTYTWSAKKKRYLRSEPWGPHVLADGTRVSTDNVLVIRAKQSFDKIYHGGGHAEPIHAIINGTGTFYYAHGGKYVTGTWTKGAVNELFQFTLDDGTALKVAPGQTFIELPNLNAKVIVKG